MSSSEDTEQSAQTFEDVTSITDALAETTYDTDALMLSVQSTEELEVLPDHRSMLPGRRQHVAPQAHKDMARAGTQATKNARRMLAQLREENKRLHHELNARRNELQQLLTSYHALQAEFEQEVALIHTGHQQDVEHYQNHLQELMEERNRLQEAYALLEQNHQELYHTFQDVVEEELKKRVTEATFALQTTPDAVPPFLQTLARTLEGRSRPVEERHLIEALFLKREVQTLAEQLQEERRQLNTERQKLMAIQQSAREQAELRQRTQKARLQARWQASGLATAVGLLVLLVALQCVFLYILHASLIASVSFSLFAPIVLCALVAWLLMRPLEVLKHIYTSAPHRKRIKKGM